MDLINPYIERGLITHLMWQPKGIDGKIIHSQFGAMMHYLTTYGEDSEWVAFIDMDEFIAPSRFPDMIKLTDYFEA